MNKFIAIHIYSHYTAAFFYFLKNYCSTQIQILHMFNLTYTYFFLIPSL